MTEYPLFAACALGTEPALLRELERIGITASQARGGVSFRATLEGAYRACLWSRVASRVIVRLADGTVNEADDLYQLAKGVPWDEHFESSSSFSVTVAGKHAAFRNTRFAIQRCKDAIVDHFRSAGKPRPDVDRTDPDLRITVFLGETCSVGLELAGGMHRRGARGKAQAPLRESLAAALLELADWDESIPLIDPFCGSGTILLEAALRCCNVAPGLLRPRHGLEAWLGHDARLWRELREDAKSKRTTPQDVVLFGSDLSSEAILQLKTGARTLEVGGVIRSVVNAFDTTPIPEGPGLVISNPPYGVRVGQERELIPLYERLGDTLKQRFCGYTVWLLLGSPSLAKHVGLQAKQKLALFNGPIECRFAEYPIFTGSPRERSAEMDAETNAATQPTASSPPGYRSASPEAAMFENRLRKNHKRLAPWARQQEIDAFRIYDGEIPEFNLRVDVFGKGVRVEEQAPPKNIPQHVADMRLKDALRVVESVLGVAQEHIVLRVRTREGGGDRDLAAPRNEPQLVQEGELQFEVNLHDYLDTGLYLGDRGLRKWLLKNAPGKSVLNLFSYTCTASATAAMGGAVRVTSVDASRTYLEWGKRNFRHNKLSLDHHDFVQGDVLEWLDQAVAARGNRKPIYDLIYCGPPTYSHSKERAPFDVLQDHETLLRQARSVLRPGGTILFFTHARRFSLAPALRAEAQELSGKMKLRDFPKSSLHVFRF